MTRLTLTPPLTTTPCRATLDVQREDIRFGNLGPGLIWLEVEVHNRGTRASQVAPMEVRVAPFGAFVASKPLDVLVVPSIPPGSSTVVRTVFQERADGELSQLDAAGRHRALGRSRLTKQLPPPPKPVASRSRARLRRAVAQMLRSAESGPGGSGAEYMCEVLDKTARWAGNFNVHIGSAETERHIASAIRLVPGMRNVAMFVVGERLEHFSFDLQGEAVGWEAGLFTTRERLPLGTPRLLDRETRIFLSVSPPSGTTEGLLAVGVTRHATSQRALVEFGFGVDTIPARCFRS